MAVLIDAVTAVIAVWAICLLNQVDAVNIKLGLIKIVLATTIVVHSAMFQARLSGHSELLETIQSVHDLIIIAFGLIIVWLIKRITHDHEN